jgi:hypothetical protein
VRDQGQHEVLGGDALRQAAVDRDGHRLRLVLHQGLGREDVLDLRRTDAEGDRTERAVRAGVAVTADDRHAGLRQAELWTDDVDDALVEVAERVQPDAELFGVPAQRLDLGAGDGVLDRLVPVERRDVVVLGGDGQVGAADGSPAQPQPLERLGAGDLVDEVQVDVEEVGFPRHRPYDVLVPDLLGQRPAHDHSLVTRSIQVRRV